MYRIDSSKPNLGLINFRGEHPTQQEIEIEQNYLNEQELNVLNRMLTAYLELAEIQTMNQTPMYMKDWKERLDEFLKITEKDILNHSGKISHQQAIKKANEEYLKIQGNNKE